MDSPSSHGRRPKAPNARNSDRTTGGRAEGRRTPRALPKPLNGPRLEEMALAYVARFATSAGRLRSYLRRKLRERGWEASAAEGSQGDAQCAMADGVSQMDALVERFVAMKYVDDESFARGRAGGLLRRGFGQRRINEALGAAGIDSDLRASVMPGEAAQRRAALALASKRRFGPFGDGATDPARRQKQLAAMLRAGHSMSAARAMVGAATVEDAENWVAEEQDDEPETGGW